MPHPTGVLTERNIVRHATWHFSSTCTHCSIRTSKSSPTAAAATATMRAVPVLSVSVTPVSLTPASASSSAHGWWPSDPLTFCLIRSCSAVTPFSLVYTISASMMSFSWLHSLPITRRRVAYIIWLFLFIACTWCAKNHHFHCNNFCLLFIVNQFS